MFLLLLDLYRTIRCQIIVYESGELRVDRVAMEEFNRSVRQKLCIILRLINKSERDLYVPNRLSDVFVTI